MKRLISWIAALVAALAVTSAPAATWAVPHVARAVTTVPQLLTAGLQDPIGSTVGPDGALYVPEGAIGRISRIDPATGARTTFASGLPPKIIPVGGVMDVAFLGGTAYALVTLVGPEFGGSAVDGVYRIDGPSTFTVIADLGTWSRQHPPTTTFFIPTGVQFAMLPYRGAFLVTDGHHNRVLRVTLGGDITQVQTYEDVVPTGMTSRGGQVYLTLAGPVPHLPENGRVVTFGASFTPATDVASGARLAVDVKFGPASTLYVLSQGYFVPGHPEGSPAEPDSGALFRVAAGGSMTSIASGLDRPVSFQIIGRTAYIVTLGGEVWSLRV
jgi:sugar lactone lactonase YvrE